jgi:hypothetical protein
MTYIREDQAFISVSVEGVPYGGSWTEAEGGNLEADDAKTRPGGMGREVSAGGPASRDDLTVRIQMSDIVALWHPHFENLTGWGRVKVGLAWLGPNRVPLGTGITRVGTVKAPNLPDMGGGSDVGMYELVVSCDEQAA